MKLAHTRFSDIKSDLCRHQKDIYDRKARFLSVLNGKVVYIRKEPSIHTTCLETRLLRNFDGPYLVIGHPYDQNDLLTLKNLSTGTVLEHPINTEKVVVVPESETNDLQPPNDAIIETDNDVLVQPPTAQVLINPELHQVAYEFAKYLLSLPNNTATASQACKHVYLYYPSSREILLHHGKLKGLVKACPYLQMEGAPHGGLYLLSRNQAAFKFLSTPNLSLVILSMVVVAL